MEKKNKRNQKKNKSSVSPITVNIKHNSTMKEININSLIKLRQFVASRSSFLRNVKKKFFREEGISIEKNMSEIVIHDTEGRFVNTVL